MALDAILKFIVRTLESPPAGTLTEYSRLRGEPLTHAAGSGGARPEIEAMAGRSRVFELAIQDGAAERLDLGQIVPTAMEREVPIRIRYEVPAAADYDAIRARVADDQTAILDALYRSEWSAVDGLSNLQADIGGVFQFSFTDPQSGRETAGLIATVIATISYDIGA